MKIVFVEANLKSDLDRIVKLINSNRTNNKDYNNILAWKYLTNPDGKPKVWIAIDEQTGKDIGISSIIPRKFKINNNTLTCWNSCDFSIEKRYRTLGIALKLRKKAKESVDNGEITAFFSHPNNKMVKIFEKANYPCIGKMLHLVKPLNIDFKMKSIVKYKFISKTLSRILNPFLCLPELFISKNRNYSFELLGNVPFDLEYDVFFSNVSKDYTIIGDRSSEYMNWRYINCPLYQTERIIIRNNEKICGYIIFIQIEKQIHLKDMVCISDDKIIIALIANWIKIIRKRQADYITAVFLQTNPMIKFFKKFTFFTASQESAVFAYVNERTDIYNAWLNNENWYMTIGDRDT